MQLTVDERWRLDRLIGRALFDPALRSHLLDQQDANLLREYGLSAEICDWLLAQMPANLADLSQAISRLPVRSSQTQE